MLARRWLYQPARRMATLCHASLVGSGVQNREGGPTWKSAGRKLSSRPCAWSMTPSSASVSSTGACDSVERYAFHATCGTKRKALSHCACQPGLQHAGSRHVRTRAGSTGSASAPIWPAGEAQCCCLRNSSFVDIQDGEPADS